MIYVCSKSILKGLGIKMQHVEGINSITSFFINSDIMKELAYHQHPDHIFSIHDRSRNYRFYFKLIKDRSVAKNKLKFFIFNKIKYFETIYDLSYIYDGDIRFYNIIDYSIEKNII